MKTNDNGIIKLKEEIVSLTTDEEGAVKDSNLKTGYCRCQLLMTNLARRLQKGNEANKDNKNTKERKKQRIQSQKSQKREKTRSSPSNKISDDDPKANHVVESREPLIQTFLRTQTIQILRF